MRIRDINNPRIHTPPQTRPSAKSSLGPFRDQLLFAMLRLHPLAGVHSIFLSCTFASAFVPFRVLLLLALGGILKWLCGLFGVRRLQFHNLPSTYGVASSQLTSKELSKQLTSQHLEEVIRPLIAPSGDSCRCWIVRRCLPASLQKLCLP